MPDGVTHFEIGVIGGIAAVLATAYVSGADACTDVATTRAVVIGSAIGLIITPDLDQEGRTFTELLLRRIPVVGFLFQVAWYPYALLFRHRGWSHNLLIGTLTRIIYAAGLLAFAALIAAGLSCALDRAPLDYQQLVQPILREAHAAVFLAWWFQDALHVLADAL